MGWESFGVVGFDLMDRSFEVKRGWPNLKVLITRLLLVLEVWDGKPNYRKSWAGNLLLWSDLTLDLSFKVNRGEPNLKVLITRLLLVLEVWDGKLTYRKAWPGNLLVWSDMTLDPLLQGQTRIAKLKSA